MTTTLKTTQIYFVFCLSLLPLKSVTVTKTCIDEKQCYLWWQKNGYGESWLVFKKIDLVVVVIKCMYTTSSCTNKKVTAISQTPHLWNILTESNRIDIKCLKGNTCSFSFAVLIHVKAYEKVQWRSKVCKEACIGCSVSAEGKVPIEKLN